MVLTDYLQTLQSNLLGELHSLRKKVSALSRQHQDLTHFDPYTADYRVKLNSLWVNEGEKPVNVEYSGNLQDAIAAAEAEFKEVNQRSDVQANYSVFLCLSENELPIPQKYWEMFQEKNKREEK
tara:strand:- start:19 stop:390 length:372 start_codon:yes stop_codon:yes gene_type:complete